MMKRIFCALVLLVCFSVGGCVTTAPNTISQVSTIDAILAGAYDGQMTCKELLKYGDFGIGTFDGLDGEMILLDGKIYQVKADGKVYMPAMNLTTPFASVVKFKPEIVIPIYDETDFKKLEQIINEAEHRTCFKANCREGGAFSRGEARSEDDGVVAALRQGRTTQPQTEKMTSLPMSGFGTGSYMNIFCAVKVKGKFSTIKTRSVPAQTKPYPPLAEVTKNQPVFDMKEVDGTIVGFRCPAFVKGINVPGYHLHFLSEDLSCGGHVLDFCLKDGEAEIDICNRFFLILPEAENDFSRVDFSKDRTLDLENAERTVDSENSLIVQ